MDSTEHSEFLARAKRLLARRARPAQSGTCIEWTAFKTAFGYGRTRIKVETRDKLAAAIGMPPAAPAAAPEGDGG